MVARGALAPFVKKNTCHLWPFVCLIIGVERFEGTILQGVMFDEKPIFPT